jgi:hypothetical protein
MIKTTQTNSGLYFVEMPEKDGSTLNGAQIAVNQAKPKSDSNDRSKRFGRRY